MFTFLQPQSIVTDALRLIFALIDGIVYMVLSVVVAVFYNVANAQLISGTIMHDFFSRIQLLLGIVVMFKLALTLFNGIINPESITDKEKGFGGVVKRIIMVLVMLILIVPLDIPGADIDDISSTGQTSWNARLNANGIAFGTLFELQSRLLKQNVIAKIILGRDGSSSEATSSNMRAGFDLSRIIFKSFLVVNETEDGELLCPADTTLLGFSETKLEEAYDIYYDEDSTPGALLTLVNLTCADGSYSFVGVISRVVGLFGGKASYYAFNYSFLISTIVGIFCIIVMVSYTIDAAIRLVKLMILYMISPVPILSYIDKNTEKNFQNWLKVVLSTYLDLFIRLAIIYVIIFLISEIDAMIGNGQNDIIGLESGGFIGILSKVFIYLGLLMFAKEAPKFITETLGLQKNNGLFGGLASLISGASSAQAGFKASLDAAHSRHPGSATTPLETARAVGAGLFTGIKGAGTGYSDYTNAKDHKMRTALDNANRANAIRRANAQQGVTFGQSLMEQARQDFTGDSTYDRLKRQKEATEADIKTKKTDMAKQEKTKKNMEDLLSQAQEKVKKKGVRVAFNQTVKDKAGNDVAVAYTGNLTDLESIRDMGKETGVYTVNGTNLDAVAFKQLYDKSVDNAVNSYLTGHAHGADGQQIQIDQSHQYMLTSAMDAAREHGQGAAITAGDYLKAFKTTAGTIDRDIRVAGDEISTREQEVASYDEDLKRAEAALRGSDGKRGGKQA